jgi:hypothetical protein
MEKVRPYNWLWARLYRLNLLGNKPAKRKKTERVSGMTGPCAEDRVRGGHSRAERRERWARAQRKRAATVDQQEEQRAARAGSRRVGPDHTDWSLWMGRAQDAGSAGLTPG